MYDMKAAAKLIGVPYKALQDAHYHGRLADPMRVGVARIYTDEDISRCKAYFATKSAIRKMADEMKQAGNTVPACDTTI